MRAPAASALCAARAMPLRERFKRRDHGLGSISQRAVTANQIRIVVDEPRVPIREPAAVVQIEKDRAAAEERLDVAAEGVGIVLAENGEELPFAASPFQQRPDPEMIVPGCRVDAYEGGTPHALHYRTSRGGLQGPQAQGRSTKVAGQMIPSLLGFGVFR